MAAPSGGPGRGFEIFALIVALIGAGLTGWVFWRSATEIHAPKDPGVCYRMTAPGHFEPLVRNSQGIEACAGDLERIHMKTGESLTGAYQGRFIFVDKEAIRSATSWDGQRWRLYFDNQRDALDKKLNAHDMVFTTQRVEPRANAPARP